MKKGIRKANKGWTRPKNFGGKQKGAGRPPAAVELKARERILAVIGGAAGFDRLIKKIYVSAMKGGFRQQELLLNYIIGKPTEKIKLDAASGPMTSSPAVVKIIADTIRLDRLSQDFKSAKAEGVTEERIKEMEDLLNKEIDKDI